MSGLRDYQTDLIARTSAALRTHRRVLMVAPTGAGKTRMGSHMLTGIAQRGQTGWFMVHRAELMHQTVDTFRRAGLETGIIADGYAPCKAQVKVCMVQSMPSRLDEHGVPDWLIVDEAHHDAAATYMAVSSHCATARKVGLTATPCRGDGKPLGGSYDALVQGVGVRWLIDNGHLSPYRYYAPDLPSLTPTNMERVLSGKAMVGSIVSSWQRLATAHITLGFAPTIALSMRYTEAMNAAGIRAAHVDGDTPDNVRRDAIMRLADRELDVLWNVGLFSEGVDLAAMAGRDVAVEAIIHAAPTSEDALGLNRQRNGRVLRVKPDGRAGVILDHVGECSRHPAPCADIEWSLVAPPKVLRQTGRPSPIARCDACLAIIPPVRQCPVCGHEREVGERQMFYVDADLREIKAADMAARKKAEEERKAYVRRRINAARTLEQLEDVAREFGYKSGWARVKYLSRQGRR